MSNSTFRIPTKEEVIAKFNAALLLECATEAHSLGRHANSNQFIDFCPTCQSDQTLQRTRIRQRPTGRRNR